MLGVLALISLIVLAWMVFRPELKGMGRFILNIHRRRQ